MALKILRGTAKNLEIKPSSSGGKVAFFQIGDESVQCKLYKVKDHNGVLSDMILPDDLIVMVGEKDAFGPYIARSVYVERLGKIVTKVSVVNFIYPPIAAIIIFRIAQKLVNYESSSGKMDYLGLFFVVLFIIAMLFVVNGVYTNIKSQNILKKAIS